MLFKTLKKLFKNNKFLSYWKTLRQYFPLHKYPTYKIMWKNNWTNKRWDFTECNTVLNPGEMLPLQLLAAVYGFEIIAFYGNFCLPDQRSNKFSLATTDTKLNFLEFRSASELERITLATSDSHYYRYGHQDAVFPSHNGAKYWQSPPWHSSLGCLAWTEFNYFNYFSFSTELEISFGA